MKLFYRFFNNFVSPVLIWGSVYFAVTYSFQRVQEYFLGSPERFLHFLIIVGFLGHVGVIIYKNFKKIRKEEQFFNPLIWTGFILLMSAMWVLGVFGERRHPVGDEPSYLMITHSLAQDIDINMNDDYRVQEYRRFYSGKYPMFTHLGYNGINYPHHSIGLPVLLAPIYRLLLVWDKPWTFTPVMRLCMAFIYSLVFYLSLQLTKLLNIDTKIAYFITAGIYLSGPLFFYSNEIYPEIVVAGVLIYAVTQSVSMNQLPMKNLFVLGIATGTLHWFGIKYILLEIALVVTLGYYIIKVNNTKKLWYYIIPVIFSTAAYFTFLYIFYRNLNPSVIYTGVIPGTGTANVRPGQVEFWLVFPERMLNAFYFLWGILLDQRIGLLFLSPVFCFAFAGIKTGWIDHRRTSGLIWILTACHLGLYAWQNNWGGFCPPNRQIIAILPLWIPFLIWGISGSQGRFARVFQGLSWIISGLISYTMVTKDRWMYHTMNPHLSGGEAQLLTAFSDGLGFRLPQFFPLMMGDIKQTGPNIIWTIIFCLIMYFSFSSSRPTRSLSFRHFVLILVLLGITATAHQYFLLPPGSARTPMENKPFESMIIIDDTHLGNEINGFWVKGESECNFILEYALLPEVQNFDLYSLTPNEVRINFGGTKKRVVLDGTNHSEVELRPKHVFQHAGKLMVKCSIRNDSGVYPATVMDTTDSRYLGVFVNIF